MEHQNVKHDLQRILAWFIIDYFFHNLDFISTSRKIFRPQTSDDDTVLDDQTDYVWNPEWSHPLFINLTIDISSAIINTVYVHKDCLRVTSLTIDATFKL